MTEDIHSLVGNYYIWLKEQNYIFTDSKTGWGVINTPFYGLFNDAIEIYFRKSYEKWVLTDGGETMRLLEESGYNMDRSPKRREDINRIILNYGLKFSQSEFSVEADEKTFPKKKHNLLQALLELHDLPNSTQAKVRGLFQEDVEAYFQEAEILYLRDAKLTGKTGLDYHFDFQIPRHDFDIVLKTANYLNKNSVVTFIYSFQDVKRLREKNSKKQLRGAVLINDEFKKTKEDLIKALEVEGVKAIKWSHREELKEYLS